LEESVQEDSVKPEAEERDRVRFETEHLDKERLRAAVEALTKAEQRERERLGNSPQDAKAAATAAYREGFQDGMSAAVREALSTRSSYPQVVNTYAPPTCAPPMSGSGPPSGTSIGMNPSLPPTAYDVMGENLAILQECEGVLSKLESSDKAAIGLAAPEMSWSLVGRVESMHTDLCAFRAHLNAIADRLGRV
jgi:hypothetical protein